MPRGPRFLAGEALLHHRDFQRVVRLHRHLLSPAEVREPRGVVGDEAPEERTESRVALRLDDAPGGAEVLRQLVSAQRQARDDPERSTAPALECPEKIRIATGVDDAD